MYKSKNELYQATVNYNYSKAQLGENGGIKTDSSLQKISNNQGNGLSINLADTKINLKRNRFRLVQSLNFNRKVIDTISQGNNFLSLRSISHTSSYERFVFLYSGSTINSDFYNNSYYDSIRTYDSLFISRINNALNFSFNAGSNVANASCTISAASGLNAGDICSVYATSVYSGPNLAAFAGA